MIVKDVPEDFVVVEVPDRSWQDAGQFLVLEVEKRSRNSEDIAQLIADSLRLPRRFIAYAGSKDKDAVTTQYFSVKGARKTDAARIRASGVSVKEVGFTSEPLSLGNLAGNRFTIMARDLSAQECPVAISSLPNLFDTQRFGTNNAEVGKAIVKRSFKEACALVLAQGGEHAAIVQSFLDKQQNNHIGALRLLPKKVVLLYVHAYQSLLFNKVLTRLLAEKTQEELLDVQIPLLGFGVEDLTLFGDLLKEEGITPRDFIIREFPDLSCEGTLRSAIVPVTDLVIGALEPDERHPGASKCVVSFFLPKGAYATQVVKRLFGKDA